MSNVKIEYAASAAVAITLASLATDTTQLVGRESDVIDNTSNKYLDYMLSGKITVGTSPTDAKEIRVYVAGVHNDTPLWPDEMDGTDSAETITSVGVRDAGLKLVAIIATNNTSDRAYYFGPVSVAALFGGVVPPKFSVFVTHNTGVNLNSTGGNHVLSVVPVYETIT
jgi:hypothetical protein